MSPLPTLNFPALLSLFFFSCSGHFGKVSPRDVTTATHHCHSSILSSVTKWVIFGQSGKEPEQNSVQVKPTERPWHFLGSLQFPSLQYRWVMSRTSLGAGAFWNITGSIDPSSLSHRPIFSPPSTNWVPEMRLSQVAVTSHCCLV